MIRNEYMLVSGDSVDDLEKRVNTYRTRMETVLWTDNGLQSYPEWVGLCTGCYS